MSELGIITCGDIYNQRGMISAMDKQLGAKGLFQAYLGLGSNVVEPPSRGDRKSIGVESYVQSLHRVTYLLWA
jgi:DNA polymerase kappa